jgi:AraC-like DNA-binding protein
MTEPDNGKGTDAARQQFLDYLSTHRLPVRDTEVRSAVETRLNFALIGHAPNSGRWFDPVDDLVIGVTLRGSGSRITRDAGRGKVEFACISGGIVATPPGCPSYWRFDGSPDVLYLSVSASVLPSLIGGDGDHEKLTARLGRYPIFDELIAILAKRLWRVASREEERFPESLVLNGVGTILDLLQGATEAQFDQVQKKTSPLSPAQLRKVNEMMERPGSRVTVGELAREINLSPDHFTRAFKLATGQTPYRMASEIRIGEAKRLLLESSQPITQIAFDLGFSSSAHFSNRFRTLTGMSPSRWRHIQQS